MMTDIAYEIVPVNLEDEMRTSYLDYAMSVIVGRALPDVRDGLKPVHRRVLYAMRELGNEWNKPYKKSARVVGDVIGRYHPHGDTAVYDALVRLAQPFSMRYPLVDGQGNFGSIDGDAPAAMRYTEVRMARIASELLADLDKETVNFVPNYDESESEPAVLPTRLPNLLVNGSSGIAVGMATNIPPHNLGEVTTACLALLDRADCTITELMQHLPGPDFPTAAIINGASGIREAYQTGRGRIYVRAKTHVETDHRDKQAIIVTELPYQVNKARLIEKIAELVKSKQLDGITELRDESDKDGLRIYIELRRGEIPEVVLNNLYQHTPLQSVFGINMVALVDGQPLLLNLKAILEAFLRHRRETVTRRTLYELRKAKERAHVLEGLAVAMANIDPLIALIKAAPDAHAARSALLAQAWLPGLVQTLLDGTNAELSRPDDLSAGLGLVAEGYWLSPAQAQAILELRLQRLTHLEQDKIIHEYRELLEAIQNLMAILTDPERLTQVIREELQAVRAQYQDVRRTAIVADQHDLNREDLIAEEDVVVTLSHAGYIKSQPVSLYQAQRRGGRGKAATTVREEDFIELLFVASTHDTVLCFSNHGLVYWQKVYELPQASRAARGRPMINLLPLSEGERINALLPVREFRDDRFLFFATTSGQVKKTPLSDYARPRPSGLIAIDLREGDQLVDVAITDGQRDIMLLTDAGQAIRFHEEGVRAVGRAASGVRGIRMEAGQRVIALIVVEPEGTILTATERGFGKRTPIADYPTKNRDGKGVIAIQTSTRNGSVIGAVQVLPDDEVLLITNAGTLIRTRVEEISISGRNTQGVKLINVAHDEQLIGIARIAGLTSNKEVSEDSVAIKPDESALMADEMPFEHTKDDDPLH